MKCEEVYQKYLQIANEIPSNKREWLEIRIPGKDTIRPELPSNKTLDEAIAFLFTKGSNGTKVELLEEDIEDKGVYVRAKMGPFVISCDKIKKMEQEIRKIIFLGKPPKFSAVAPLTNYLFRKKSKVNCLSFCIAMLEHLDLHFPIPKWPGPDSYIKNVNTTKNVIKIVGSNIDIASLWRPYSN